MKLDWSPFTYDKEWLQSAADEEAALGIDVEAGVWLANRKVTRAPDPAKLPPLLKAVRLQAILFTELKDWMESWNLGAGLDDAMICARRIIRLHLSDCSEDEQAENPPILRQQVVSQLHAMLTPEDWQAIAQAASQSIAQQVLVVQQAPSFPAAS
jgi:hypothetical protein